MTAVQSTQKAILIVCSHFWPSRGGLESRMGQFSAELVRAGYDVTVLTAEFPGRNSDRHQGVKIISVPAAALSGSIRAAVLSEDYDSCILVQDPLGGIIWSVEGLTPPPKTRLFIQPIINEDGYGRWKNHTHFPQRLAQILKSAAAALAMTRSGPDIQYMRSMGIDGVYLPNATSPVLPAGDFRREYGIGQNRFLILHVANLFWVKNHIGLIDALPDMPASWQLVMIGHPSGEPDCVKAVQAKLASRPDIVFIPGVSREWVSAAMQTADVVVLASTGEGSPNTILEAMSQRKPWLATKQCGAVHDHLGGIVCDLAQFRDYLFVLEKHADLRHALAQIGYSHWQQCYSWPVALQGWMDLIEYGSLQREFSPAKAQIDEMQRTKKMIEDQLARQADLAIAETEEPLVSIIVPTYNRPDFLERSLASILEQNYANLEIIVVNDGGCSVESVVSKHNDRRLIHYVALGANGGAAASRNCGLRLARGHYVALLDDDDEYLPEHISSMVTALRGNSRRFAYARAEYLIETRPDQQPKVEHQRPFSQVQYSRDLLMVGNFIPTPTWVFERSLLDETGLFDETFSAWEDWEWLIRASSKTDFICVPQFTVRVHQRPDDASHLGVRHRPEMRKWFEQVYAKHPAPSPEIAALRSAYLKNLFREDQILAEPLSTESGLALAAALPSEDQSLFNLAGRGSLDILDLVKGANRLAERNQLVLAAELYRLWLRRTASPLKFVAAFNMGCLFGGAGMFEEAEQSFRRALAYNPAFPQARFNLAGQLERRGHLEEALAHWHWICRPENGVAASASDIFEMAQANLQRCRQSLAH